MQDTIPAADVLVTAEDAFPALERLVLGATRRVRCSFRIFDAMTLLQSDEGQAVGTVWLDLIVHKLRQGVNFDIILTDFDPIARPELHEMSWSSLRKLVAADEAAGGPGRLSARVSMHPGRVGWLARLVFWPKVYTELRKTARHMMAMPGPLRREVLLARPGLEPMLVNRDGRLSARRWPLAPLVPATHHQKIAVIDDDALYIGGLDLNDRRWDTREHDRPAPESWHDVQVLLRDKRIVADAHRHIDSFEAINRGADPGDAGAILRTISARRPRNLLRLSPKTVVSELREAHLAQIEAARDFIYIENQFFRDKRVSHALARAGKRHPNLSLVMVLPGAPEELAFGLGSDADSHYGEYLQARAVDRVVRAFGPRALILAPAMKRRARPEDGPARARLHRAPIVYVHAKVSIFDHATAFVSSANLNGRSLSWDTEAGVRLTGDDALAALRKCSSHWMGEERAFLPGETGLAAVTRWRGIVAANVARVPELRDGFLLPYPLHPARLAGRFVPVPEEMV